MDMEIKGKQGDKVFGNMQNEKILEQDDLEMIIRRELERRHAIKRHRWSGIQVRGPHLGGDESCDLR